ncbi:MAG: translation elongation factor Ts [Patescibacteria group bacterium]
MDLTKLKQLRSITGAGIADCREALDHSGGDITKAENYLKEKGIEKAVKKSDRETGAGLVESYVHGGGKIGVLIEINCETDFVGRTDDFKTLAHELAMQVSAMNPKDTSDLMKQAYIRDPQITIEALIKSAIAKLGENITVNRFSRIALGE